MLHRPYHHFGPRFFFEEDTGGNATVGASTGTLSDLQPDPDGIKPPPTPSGERVEGEKLPDFSGLGKKKPEEAEKGPKEGEAPSGKEKLAGEAPETLKKAVKETLEAAKQPEKKAEAAKAKEAAKEPAKAAEKVRPTEDEKLPEIPKDDKDLEALQPKPNAPDNVKKSFNEMKALMIRERGTARAYAAKMKATREEAEELKGKVGKLPPEVEQELAGLKKVNLLFQAENDPYFKKEFDEKIGKVDEKIFGLLTKHGLNEKIVAEIKEAADKGSIESWPRWADLLNKFANPLDRQEVLDAIKERRDVVGSKATKLAEITQDREKFLSAVGDRQKNEQLEFAKGIERKSIDLAAANEWILEQEIPADADAEQKKVLEARNAEVAKRAEAFSENVRDAYSRDPDKTATVALNAVKAAYLEEQLEESNTARDKATARVRELEAQLAKIRNAGRMAHTETPGAEKTAAKEGDGMVGGDGSSAIRNFAWKKSGG